MRICKPTIGPPIGKGSGPERVWNIEHNPTRIGITHLGVTDGAVMLNTATTNHQGQNPNGMWTFEVTRRLEALDFARNKKQVCVRIYMRCP